MPPTPWQTEIVAPVIWAGAGRASGARSPAPGNKGAGLAARHKLTPGLGAGASATRDYLNSGRPVSGLIAHGRWGCN